MGIGQLWIKDAHKCRAQVASGTESGNLVTILVKVFTGGGGSAPVQYVAEVKEISI